MLELANTRFGNSVYRPVATGFTIATEGVPLSFVVEDGITKVRPTSGGASDVWAGISMSRNAELSRATEIVERTIPSAPDALEVKLAHEPNANEYRLVAGDTVLTEGDPANANEFALDGKKVTFNAAQEGQVVTVYMAYTPNFVEASAFLGNAPIGGLASTAEGIIGVVTRGDIYTDQFDISADWSNAIKVYMGANGLFSPSSAGGAVEIPGAVVLQQPTVGSAFLGIELRA